MRRTVGILFLVVILVFGCTFFGEEKPQYQIPKDNITQNETNETEEYLPPEPVNVTVMNETIGYTETPAEEIEVYFINVGYGDCTLIKKGDFDILIDAGGTEEQGERIVEFLENKEVDDLELVIATMYTKDHIAGMRNVFQRFKVEQYWDNGMDEKGNKYYDELQEIIELKNIPIKHPEFGERVFLNGISITVLNPQKTKYPTGNPTLNSVTLHIVDREFALYMTDVEAGVQNTILANYPNIKSNIMKVPNHGASTVAVGGGEMVTLFSIIDKVQPEKAVVFVGPNELGMPNPTVLEAYKVRGADVLRTDLNGTIEVISDGYEYNITTGIEQE